MSRIKDCFNKKAFIAFLTGGDPCIEATEEFILKLEEAGAGLIEIGIPFSDPIAEGPVIQEADIRALSAGTTPDKLFDMVKRLREKTQIPLVFMTYLNPVFHYGYDAFFTRCAECGIDGIIIPDMPFEEKGELDKICEEKGVDLISMIAPTSENRIKEIASESKGFLYIVSSLGVTGVRTEIKTDLKSIVDVVKSCTDTPCAIGFGINTPEQVGKMSEFADGVIVGSAIVKIIAKEGANAGNSIYNYVSEMTAALK